MLMQAQTASYWLKEGQKLRTEGYLVGACNAFEQAFLQDPNLEEAALKHAECLLNKGNYSDSRRIIDNLTITKNEHKNEQLYLLAQLALVEGKFTEAKEKLSLLKMNNSRAKKSYFYQFADAELSIVAGKNEWLKRTESVEHFPLSNAKQSKLGITFDRQNHMIYALYNPVDGSTRLESNYYELLEVNQLNYLHLSSPFFELKTGKLYFTATKENGTQHVYVAELLDKRFTAPKKIELKNSPIKEFGQLSVFTYNEQTFALFTAKIKNQESIYFAPFANTETLENPIKIALLPDNSYVHSTPWFSSENKTLYFAAKLNFTEANFNLYKTQWNPDTLAQLPEKIWTTKSIFNEIYPSINPNNGQLWFASNRPIQGEICCTNYFFINNFEQIKPVLPTVEPMESTTSEQILADLSQLLPLKLYFDNDEPKIMVNNPNKSNNNIKNLSISYQERKQIYINRTSEEDKLAVEEKFTAEISTQISKLEFIFSGLQQLLNAGENVQLQIKGYASPLASEQYNLMLSARRIDSFLQFLSTWNNSALVQYIEQKQLNIQQLPMGTADAQFTNETEEQKIFGIKAVESRKIEILRIYK